MDWYLMGWKKYARFEGRSRRKEYWVFALINTLLISLVSICVAAVVMRNGSEDEITAIRVTVGICALIIFVPSLAVAVRRLHDSGKSGWLILICLIPYIGGVVNIVLMCLDSEPGTNRYGPNPKFPEHAVGVLAGNAGFAPMGFPVQQPHTGETGGGFCSTCGVKLPDGSPFCGNCGARI
jgi:uncharacterized membrane protein YhaH (DUF805 family)